MKIAFVSYAYGSPPMLGEKKPWMYGSGRYTNELIKALSEFGLGVSVFSPKIYIRNTGSLAFMLENGLKNFKNYDIIHSNEASGVFIKHRNKIETIHHMSLRSDPKNRFTSSILMRGIRNAKHIVVPSYATKRTIMCADKKLPEDKISVIYHGVSEHVFNNSETNRKLAEQFRVRYGLTDHFVVITVGRLEKHKNQIDIIKAMANLKNSVLILVGRGKEKNSLINFAKKKKIQMLYFDYVPDNELTILYNSSDVYVHSSILEGFGLTVLESMTCGLPVVAYKTADFNYLVGDAGYLIDAGDIDGISSALCFLRDNQEIRSKMSRIAVFRSKSFSWSEAARKHMQVYRKVLDKG